MPRITQSRAVIFFLLGKVGEIVGRTRLQKLVFLVLVEALRDPEDYRRHFYGPYSDQAMRDSIALEALGLLTSTTRKRKTGPGSYTIYQLTRQGSTWIQKNADKFFKNRLARVEAAAKAYLDMPTEDLLEYVYSYVYGSGEERMASALRQMAKLWEGLRPANVSLFGRAVLEYAEKAARASSKMIDDVHRNVLLASCKEVIFAAVECIKELDQRKGYLEGNEDEDGLCHTC